MIESRVILIQMWHGVMRRRSFDESMPDAKEYPKILNVVYDGADKSYTTSCCVRIYGCGAGMCRFWRDGEMCNMCR